MTLTEIKKALYKTKPTATLQHIRKIGSSVALVYLCHLCSEYGNEDIIFDIPSKELTDGLYGKEMPAQLLIPYIVQPEMTQS